MSNDPSASQLSPQEDSSASESGHIGSFSAYNRRPLPSLTGLTAQFYGENGDDADMISALSLTKFLEAEVQADVYLIKDANGKIMKDPVSNSYPKIASFPAKIQRPKPQRDGMVAQFFAFNGDAADQVNQLGLTKYMDAFVYVDILRSSAGAPAETPLPPEEIRQEIDQVAGQLTPSQRKALAKKSKAFGEANRLLRLSGFLAHPNVWAALGSEPEFEAWIGSMGCCAPGEAPCKNAGAPYRIPAESHQRYFWIPLCPEHRAIAESGVLPGGLPFMKMRQKVLAQEWAWERLRSAIGTPPDIDEPDPQAIMSWAFENKLSQYVPPNYLNKFG